MKFLYKPLKIIITENTVLFMPTGNYRKPYCEYFINIEKDENGDIKNIFAKQHEHKLDCSCPFILNITKNCVIKEKDLK